MAASAMQVAVAQRWSPGVAPAGFGNTKSCFMTSSGKFKGLALLEKSRPETSIKASVKAGELASQATSVASSEMSDFADLQERRFRDDLMIILDQDGFPAEIRPTIRDLCGPIFRRYAAAYKGTVPPEPFLEMRRAMERAQVDRFKDVLCAAIGWARWNMAKDFRAWYAARK